MSLTWMRVGTAGFFVMSCVLALNLHFFQPVNARNPASRTAALSMGPAPASGFETAATDRASDATVDLTPGHHAPVGAAGEVTRAIQRELQARGYEAGQPDGVPGIATRAAIIAYESDHGLQLTAEPSEDLLREILLGGSGSRVSLPTDAPGPHAEQVIRQVQQALARLGYKPGRPDGRMGEGTVRAIRDFEGQQGLSQSGRVSAQLVARLFRLAGQGRVAHSP